MHYVSALRAQSFERAQNAVVLEYRGDYLAETAFTEYRRIQRFGTAFRHNGVAVERDGVYAFAAFFDDHARAYAGFMPAASRVSGAFEFAFNRFYNGARLIPRCRRIVEINTRFYVAHNRL